MTPQSDDRIEEADAFLDFVESATKDSSRQPLRARLILEGDVTELSAVLERLLPVERKKRRKNLTPDQARDIRRRLAAGEGCNEIAQHFGVSMDTVRCIEVGKTWRGLRS